jgi:hypothetical protein
MVGIVQSSYYRIQALVKKGISLVNSLTMNLKLVNQDTVESIKAILSNEFVDCGYRLMTSYLQRDGYQINHKSSIGL